MSEVRNPKEKHDLYKRIGIWIVLSALIIVAFAAVVGTLFEKYGEDRAEIEEVVFLPVNHDYSRGMSTMSYSMAAKYSDGQVVRLPDSKENGWIMEALQNDETSEEDDGGTRNGDDVWEFTYGGNSETWTIPRSG